MKRFLAPSLAASLLAAVIGVVGSSSPASASHAPADVWVGFGTMTMSSPLYYPVTTGSAPSPAPGSSGTFGLALPIGTCAIYLGWLSATGSYGALGGVGAYCGGWTGSGSTTSQPGHSFAFIGAGPLMVFTGGVVGVANWVPNAFTTPPSSCNTGVTNTLFQGAVALL